MEKRRRPRALILTLPNRKQPFLVLGGRRYTLRNFSQEGIGVWAPTPAPIGLNRGVTAKGDIVVESEVYPVQLELMHRSNGIIGLKIVHKSAELTRIFAKLLEPAQYAMNLRPHPLSGSEDPENGYPRLWYQGGVGVEMVVWYNDLLKLILASQLCFLGRWVYRHQFRPAETGFVPDETPDRSGRLLRNEDLLLKHSAPDIEFLQSARVFLSAISPPLPGHLLWQFLETGEQVYLPADIFKALTKVA